MSIPVEISWHFFGLHSLGLSSVEDQLQTEQFEDWKGDFAFLDGDINSLRSASELEGTTEYVRLALDYFISAGDADLPQALQPHGIVLGELVGNAELTGLGDDALHELASYVRRKMFPELPEMTNADRKAALARVRLTNQDLRDWMYHLVFPDEPPLTKEQCRDPQTHLVSSWMHALRKQKLAGGPHWPHVPIVFSTPPYAK